MHKRIRQHCIEKAFKYYLLNKKKFIVSFYYINVSDGEMMLSEFIPSALAYKVEILILSQQ